MNVSWPIGTTGRKVNTMLKIINSYASFNQRRYSDPWVARVKQDGKLDFSSRCGGYTGRYRSGEEGDLYVTDPVEGAVYAYGQKDYRGNNTEMAYAQFSGGEFRTVEKRDLVRVLNDAEKKEAAQA